MMLNDMLSAGKDGKPIRPLGSEGQEMLLAAKVVSGKMLNDAAQQREQRVKEGQLLKALQWDTLQAQRKAVEKDEGFNRNCENAEKVPTGMSELLHIKAETFVKSQKIKDIIQKITAAERQRNIAERKNNNAVLGM